MFNIIISGASVILDLIGSFPDYSPSFIAAKTIAKALMPTITVIVAASDLAFDLGNRARIHSMMKRRYFELLADVLEGGKSVESANAALNRLAADEEPAFHALLNASWNAAQEMVFGDGAGQYKLTYFEMLFKHLLRYQGTKFKYVRPASN
jgi:hypothetical protein